MDRRTKCVFLLILAISLAMASSPLDAVAKGNADFSRDFFKEVALSNQGNIISSPFSLLAALAMVHTGAKGKSNSLIAQGLHLPEKKEDALEGLRQLMEKLRNVEKVELSIANKIFVKAGFDLVPDYISALEKTFNVTAENVNFLEAAAASTINDWVKVQTKEKIQNIVKSSDFDSLTRMVLVNAIYFKGPWLKPFIKSSTQDRPFYSDETNSIEVPFMYQKSYFEYAKLDDLEAQLLILPYTGKELSMAIILPDKRTGLPELEKKLATADLGEILQKAHNKEVEVYLPKFKIETTLDLQGVLSKMGLGHMFTNDADLSGISESEPLQVSKVLQKAFIEVSEEGTEAAAATVKRMRPMARPPNPALKIFEADHPFIFSLLSESQKSPPVALFFGRLLQLPEASKTEKSKRAKYQR
ncbi:leukocyte elastase inhibitor-like isoform X2 [Neocloeon triangulifer]|uniref:leukocyte elastase inhibitor-like isoform X2 n=1 Tax=Neocloeon triangulifer TaxID=2078957 RepID=UPI00286EDE40|nr:leukocyte elastase inhibitor-like isoform X2 [Neocloeon triangulifer]